MPGGRSSTGQRYKASCCRPESSWTTCCRVAIVGCRDGIHLHLPDVLRRPPRLRDISVLQRCVRCLGVSVGSLSIRGGSRADSEPLTTLYLRSRAAAMPWLVSPHDETATRWWMEHVVLAAQRVWVAHSSDRLLGFAAVDGPWLEQLYVDPGAQARGVGRALLDTVKDSNPAGLMLHVFSRNFRARKFYEFAGFVLTEQSDGRRNEEREPDCTYTWPADRNPVEASGT